jgi:hypothetical protein
MAMHHVGWMHRDVSAGNCILSCNPKDGPSFVCEIELSKKMNSQTPVSRTAISVSGPECLNESYAYNSSQGSMQFMGRSLLQSLNDQEDSDFVHLPQHDLESLVYVLAYAVMKKECATKPVKIKGDTKAMREAKLSKMKKVYDQAFGHSTVGGILAARRSFRGTWAEYRLIVTGNQKPSVLHDIVGTLLVQVDRQYTVGDETYEFLQAEDAARPAVLMDGKRMRKVLKQGIAAEKARLTATSPDSDVDANYDSD